MQKLAEVCIRRPVFASMLAVALIVIGATSYVRLAVDRYPAVDLPTVYVRASLPGASPEEVETEITYKLEEAVNTVAGVDQLRSVSTQGAGIVIATFDLGRDIDVAAQDVRDRVSAVMRDLPDETEPPVVSKANSDSEPVLQVAVIGERSIRDLTELADKVARVQIERADGVGEVRITGGLQRTMNVWLDSDKLIAYGIPVTAVRDAILAQNADVPGGNITAHDKEQSLRTLGRLVDENGFRDLVVATVDGVPIHIGDLGRAEDGTAERRTIARWNGTPTVVLEIVRQSGANTVDVIEKVKSLLPRVEAQLPSDVHLQIVRDQSNYIYAALHEINTHLVLGSILASLVVLAFMRNWRSTLIAAVAIPTSVVATFGAMWALGFTLNSVTMLALVLMVGIVIDDAIVVLENIFRFVEEKHVPPMEAAREATREIGLAVLATTLSLVVIFVPVSFMSSIAGRFLYQFGITAAVAVLVSLFISFSLTPMMAARLLRSGQHSAGGDAASRRGFYRHIDSVYSAMLQFVLRHRIATSAFALLVIASSVWLRGKVQQEFVPSDIDEAEFNIRVTAPEGTSVDAMDEAMVAIEQDVRATPGVRDVLATTGGGFIGQVNQGSFYVRIAPHEERLWSFSRMLEDTLRGRPQDAWKGNYTQSDVSTAIDARLKRFKDLRIAVSNFQSINIGGGPFDVEYVIRGPELESLNRFGEELRKRSLDAGGFRGLDTTLRLNKPELRVQIDRERAADLGIRARDIGSALRLMVGGAEEVSRFRDPDTGESYDVRLRLEERDRSRPDLIEQLYLPTQGGLVQLSNVASIQPSFAPSRIDRVDRQRMVSVRGALAPGFALGERIQVMTKLASELGMPQSYTSVLFGRSRELERTFKELLIAFVLSVVFMYLILASQFESLVHPLTILLSLPLSIPFALLSLWLTGGTLNLYSALGILVLFGVVKKNAILQIDHTNTLRAQGLDRAEAILRANRDRLRPILMTTLALVAGMLPLALGTGPGSEERRAVAVVVIGGQSMCLLLTLLVTPVAYSLFDDVAAVFRRKRAPVAMTLSTSPEPGS
jgi:HAE1 family hydrophobic/amphiphilic exporter-1